MRQFSNPRRPLVHRPSELRTPSISPHCRPGNTACHTAGFKNFGCCRTGAVCLWVIALLASPAWLSAAERLNVLHIVSDDLNNVLGCYGHPLVQTPQIDRLAKRGVRFDRAYCQFPLCNPSRTSFLTGLRPDSTTVYDNAKEFRSVVPQVVTLPQHFQKQGYFVARVGKLYHYGVPNQIGTAGLDDPPSWQETVNPRGKDKDDEPQIFSLVPGQFGGTLSWLAADGTDEQQTDGIGAAATIKLLEAHQHESFFIACGFYRPHTPYVAPKPWFGLYPLASLSLPQEPANDRDDIPLPALTVTPPHYGMPESQQKEALQAYLASISFMDHQLGHVLDALDRLKLTERTIIVFHSDHGYHLGEHGMWQKQSLFEESARVPLIISAPGLASAGQATQGLAELIDVYPTLVELTGGTPASWLPGRSLLPQLRDPQQPGKACALTQVRRGGGGGKKANQPPFAGYSLRTDRYRANFWDDGQRGTELYDHQEDPREFTNLAALPEHQGTVQTLRKLLQDTLAATPSVEALKGPAASE
jgi:iduronate 2-sulfatase